MLDVATPVSPLAAVAWMEPVVTEKIGQRWRLTKLRMLFGYSADIVMIHPFFEQQTLLVFGRVESGLQ
jgi:hypothetical protein